MLEIGAYHNLKIDRDTSPGLFLVNEEGDEVLLPGQYMPKEFEIGDELRVYVYLDNDERPVATTLKPLIEKDGFAFLRCTDVSSIGGFVDWGIEKQLFVPFANQVMPMKKGQYYVTHMYLDEKSNRLVGSTKLNNFLKNENVDVSKFDKVEIMVSHYSDNGANVIINGKYKGLVYKDTIFEDLRVGDKLPAYIKRVREDGKIDVLLQPEGYKSVEPNANYILDEIKANGGRLNLHDKSSPEEIQAQLGLSKKSFKKAVGVLYKERQIDILEDSIVLKEQ